MKFFVDTANIEDIEKLIPTGFVDGVTTNPSLIAKQGEDMAKTIKKICSILHSNVAVAVLALGAGLGECLGQRGVEDSTHVGAVLDAA